MASPNTMMYNGRNVPHAPYGTKMINQSHGPHINQPMSPHGPQAIRYPPNSHSNHHNQQNTSNQLSIQYPR